MHCARRLSWTNINTEMWELISANSQVICGSEWGGTASGGEQGRSWDSTAPDTAPAPAPAPDTAPAASHAPASAIQVV